MLDFSSSTIFPQLQRLLEAGFSDLPAFSPQADKQAMLPVLEETARRLHNNYPYPHPLYAGQMLKPPHPIAATAYALAMQLNPNNHAMDGSRASSPMEKEAVAHIAHMFGWPQHLGHLTSGGTVANMEALWIAAKEHPGKAVVAQELAHYTHERISGVLGIPFDKIGADKQGRMSLLALESRLLKGDVGTVVVTLGTTGLGAIDPLPEILELQQKFAFRIHVDAAYGGYFTLVNNLSANTRKAFDLLTEVDSIVIDPHKHGLQPYGCGCVLFRNPEEGRHYSHDSPYTYFTSEELHLGEISLECSRAGASAVALWATQRYLPNVKDGQFAAMLENCRNAALEFHRRLSQSQQWLPLLEPELDIVNFAEQGEDTVSISQRSQAIFQAAAQHDLHLALLKYPTRLLPDSWQGIKVNSETVTLLRTCLMKPEHLNWLDEIWKRLELAGKENMSHSKPAFR